MTTKKGCTSSCGPKEKECPHEWKPIRCNRYYAGINRYDLPFVRIRAKCILCGKHRLEYYDFSRHEELDYYSEVEL